MAERVFVRSIRRVGFTGVTVHERNLFGVDDCARYPLFGEDLLATMRRTIPRERHDEVATCVTVSASKPFEARSRTEPSTEDAAGDDLIASGQRGNPTARGGVLHDMSEQLPTFDAGRRACGDGIGRDLRGWWAGLPAATRTALVVRDPSSKTDVPALARMLGHAVERQTETDGALRLIVRTKGEA
ncbi:MAG: hypothetical protein GEU81_09910 [Nitriliruptorales bacterium]|nr:hypothetical protein [Nitriliruptorales bacterium]